MVTGFYDDKQCYAGAALQSGWRSEIDRGVRLGWAALTLAMLPESEISIVDAGCANGALVNYLQDTHRKHYIGVDAFPGFVAEARAEFPDAQFVFGDLRQLTIPADIVVAIGATVGNVESTSVDELYEFARRCGAKTLLLTGPTSTNLDDAISAVRPPVLPDGWHRTMGPEFAGELWWVDSHHVIPAVGAKHCFEHARGLVSDSPGATAMVAARLGLRDELAAIARESPHDDGVLLALDYFEMVR